jgi:hypothetical protein
MLCDDVQHRLPLCLDGLSFAKMAAYSIGERETSHGPCEVSRVREKQVMLLFCQTFPSEKTVCVVMIQ